MVRRMRGCKLRKQKGASAGVITVVVNSEQDEIT
jgi:hypothetical protein